jgi:hypothetical protein
MSSYPPPLPPAGTYQPQQPSFPSRPEANRSRANSAAAEKYRPRTYSNPPPNQPDPTLLGPYQHPYTPPDPSFYPQQQHQPPYPQTATSQPQLPIPMPMPMPQQVLIPSYPNLPISAPGPSSRHSSYAHPRPPMPTDYNDDLDDSGRRHSYSSQLSRHSHDSRRSRDSKLSRHSRHSADGKAHHEHKREQQQHPHRTNERPTMGDSLVSMFGLIKSALGPRDK